MLRAPDDAAPTMGRRQAALPPLPLLLLLAGLAGLALPAPAAAHGFIIAPAARNYIRNWNWCPHCVNGGGPSATSRGGQLTWPASAAAACGDASLATAGAPVATCYAGAGADGAGWLVVCLWIGSCRVLLKCRPAAAAACGPCGLRLRPILTQPLRADCRPICSHRAPAVHHTQHCPLSTITFRSHCFVLRCFPWHAVIEIRLFITAQHGGRHVFRLCPGPNMTTACLTAPAAMLQRCVQGVAESGAGAAG